MRAAILGALLLAGCAGAEPSATGGGGPPARTATFTCEGGGRLKVTFQGGTATLVDPQGRSFQLSQQVSGSGIRYQGQGQTLQGRGDEMTWTAPGLVSRACSAADNALVGTRWQLVKFQSSDDAIGTQTPEDTSRYVLELEVGGRLAAQLDCNRAVGRWEAHPTGPKQGTISLAAPAMTRAMCLRASWDERLARDFEFVRSYTLEGDQLHLALKLDSGIYTWRRLP